MAHELHIDFETRSVVDLKKSGVYRYAMDPTTDLWCASYAFDAEPVESWLPHQPIPERIYDHVRSGRRLFAWNAQFERIIWKCILAPRYRWPEPKLEQWDDPMVWALAMSFPAQLGGFGQAMAMHMQKDDAGRRLMLQMAKPRSIRDDGTPVWWDLPNKIERLVAYCNQDVEAEREATVRLLPLSEDERQNWIMDQRINDRGIKVDMPFVEAGQRIVLRRLAKLDARITQLTKGRVDAASNVGDIGDWMRQEGFPTPSLDKDHVKGLLLRPDLTPAVREVLEIRQKAGKSSTAKLSAFEAAVCNDNRLRGIFQFHKAGPGRWSSVIVQLHNMPRGTKEHQGHFDELCDVILQGDDDWLEVEFGDPMEAVSSTLRGCLVPARGKVFVVRDFSAIEAVNLAWLSGEQWKLQAFRDYNAGTGPDMYKLAYARAFQIHPNDVTKAGRQIGKVMELAMGYQGGVGAFVSMAATTGLDLEAMAQAALPILPLDVLELAGEAYRTRGDKSMDPNIWVACEGLKILWRRAHPATVQFWRNLEEAAVAAVLNAGQVFAVEPSGIKYRVANGHLWCRLPSGRLLCYPFPAVKLTETPWGTERWQLSYMGMNATTHQWERQYSYGGHQAENVDQGLSSCFLRRAMRQCEAEGLPIVLHVHDEIVCEVAEADGERVLARMGEIMGTPPPFAADCPISSAGFITHRYRKE